MAIKRLPLGLADEDDKAVQSEVQFMRSCSHPNIVRYDGAFICQQERELWIVMELCDGGSMSDVLRRAGSGLEEVFKRGTKEVRLCLSDRRARVWPS